MSGHQVTLRLKDAAPDLERVLTRPVGDQPTPPTSAIRRDTLWIRMRDGIRLATDVYLPHNDRAPTVAMRTPYGRARRAETCLALAERGYVVIAQDCRGTGDSEPDSWDYYIYEEDDSYDLVEWITQQPWFNGFIGGCGGSYLASTQWCMAAHPRMSTIVPEVGALGVDFEAAPNYMFVNAYARSVGKGANKVPVHYSDLEKQMIDETLADGYFNEPLETPLSDAVYARFPHLRSLPVGEAKRRLWRHYCESSASERVELLKSVLGTTEFTYLHMNSLDSVFGHRVIHGVHALPCIDPANACSRLHAPPLLITGWYDWGLNDALATWDLLSRGASERLRSHSRLLITPSAHNVPGYHEGKEDHPELERAYRTSDIVDLLCLWYDAVRNRAVNSWPTVVYYLMGANEWHAASAWPPQEARSLRLYLAPNGGLTPYIPEQGGPSRSYIYNPEDPTPTAGGSIVSYVYPPGSAVVNEVQKRTDVVTYSTKTLSRDLDVVGPIRLMLYASSSAKDTDFCVRISDVFPDGRAIHIQSGILRARYRNRDSEPRHLTPGQIYLFEIDVWATANRFKAGHRLCVDISSADFPRFHRNANLGGEPGRSSTALQVIHHGPEHPSHLLLSVVGDSHIDDL